MEWVMVGGCVLAGWVLLRIVGGERQRRLAELEALRLAAEPHRKEQEKPAAAEIAKSR